MRLIYIMMYEVILSDISVVSHGLSTAEYALIAPKALSPIPRRNLMRRTRSETKLDGGLVPHAFGMDYSVLVMRPPTAKAGLCFHVLSDQMP